MKAKANLIKTGMLAGLALLGVSCTQSGEEAGAPSDRALIAPQSLEKEITPKPFASIAMPNGNEVEFYDFESSTLIVESGVAGTPPVMTKDFKKSLENTSFASPGDRLFAVWNKLAPTSPIPEGLKAFHQRWKDRPANAATRVRPRVSLELSGPSVLGSREISGPMAKKAAPQGCNNGCCDFEWLSTFGECQPDWDVNWFFFNAKASKANVPDVERMVSMVCAATGTSQWSFHIGDSKANWSVAQQHFKTFSWSAGWFDQDLSSSVNSAAAPRLHTYCGDIIR